MGTCCSSSQADPSTPADGSQKENYPPSQPFLGQRSSKRIAANGSKGGASPANPALSREWDSAYSQPSNFQNGGGLQRQVQEPFDAPISVKWTGMRIAKAFSEQLPQLVTLEDALNPNLVVEGEAVAVLWRIMRTARRGVTEGPKAAFLFVESNWLSGQQLAAEMALKCYGSPDCFVRLNLTHCKRAEGVSHLIGTDDSSTSDETTMPPSRRTTSSRRTAHREPLAETILRHPQRVILLEVVEAAHPDVLNLIIQILEEGRISDAQGCIVDFQETIVVITSVAASSIIQPGVYGPGFKLDVKDEAYNRTKVLIIDEIKSLLFKAERLSWLRNIAPLWHMSESEVKEMAYIMLQVINEATLLEDGIRISVTVRFQDVLVDQAYNIVYAHGAQPLRRAIKLLLEDSMADWSWAADVSEGDAILVDVDPSNRIVVFAKDKPPGSGPPLRIQDILVSSVPDDILEGVKEA